jgi:hypothetical protein
LFEFVANFPGLLPFSVPRVCPQKGRSLSARRSDRIKR